MSANYRMITCACGALQTIVPDSATFTIRCGSCPHDDEPPSEPQGDFDLPKDGWWSPPREATAEGSA